MQRKKTKITVNLKFEYTRENLADYKDCNMARDFICDIENCTSPDAQLRIIEQEGSDEFIFEEREDNHGGKTFYASSLGEFLEKYANFVSNYDVGRVLLDYAHFVRCDTSTTTEIINENPAS